AALDPEEPVSWDDDSESDTPSTPQPKASSAATNTVSSTSHSSTATIQPQAPTSTKSTEASGRKDSLKPSDGAPRRSQDQHSQTDSDASYDLVSGATSRAPGSPKEERGIEGKDTKKEESDDDEPDWE
ncbi:MAG: hypothetical protein Q9225_007573, partial [Loekoesia sp. 1 TL-2023]